MPIDAHPALRTIAVVWVAAVGAAIGSFLNVVIARLPHGRSIVRPRSACPRCGTPIAWYDNVPILSWLLLRARCRACREPISVRYPLVEVLVAAAAVWAVERHDLGLVAVAELAFVAALVALAFIDLDTWLLPHALTWPLIATGLLASAAHLAPAGRLGAAATGAALGFAAFAAVSVVGSRVFRREALGWGDVWLLAGIGAWLGAPALLPVVLLASLQGSVFGVALLLLGRAQPGPPGPPSPAADASKAELAAHRQPTGTEATDSSPHPGREPGARNEGEPVERPAPAPADADADWVPPRNAVPFGPFLALAALEWLYLGSVLARWTPVLGIFR